MFSGKTVLLLAGAIAASGLATAADFNRDVRPILTSNCYKCHGPDAGARKAKLRLDKEKTARPVLKELLKRISSHDPDEIMPPPKSGKKLTPAQIQTLR
jgi:mono/diheme cytochrome c family protein